MPPMKRVIFNLLLAAATLGDAVAASAEQPFSGRLLVFESQPKKLIQHGIEWQGPVDPQRRETMLAGPVHYAVSVGEEPAAQSAVFNWYQLEDAPQRKPTRVRVRADQDAPPPEFELGNAAYFLSTAQRISDGTPLPVPETLSHFVAYQVLGDEKSDLELTWTSQAKPTNVTLKRAILFCVPVEEWHHHEHFPVKHSSTCLVVYEIDPIEATEPSVTVLDQFGLHALQLKSAKWICVAGQDFELERSDP